jgi:hypothetical protein
MGLLTTIKLDLQKFENAAGTDIKKFETAFMKVWGKAPSAEQAIQNFIAETAPYITAAVTLADPIAEPAVASALAVAETGLAAIQAATDAVESGTSLVTDLQNFSTKVPQLLSGLQIKNPVLTAAITRIVNLVTGESKILIPLAQQWAAQLAPPAPPAAA